MDPLYKVWGGRTCGYVGKVRKGRKRGAGGSFFASGGLGATGGEGHFATGGERNSTPDPVLTGITVLDLQSEVKIGLRVLDMGGREGGNVGNRCGTRKCMLKHKFQYGSI